MSATVSQVRQALAARLQQIPGLQVYPYFAGTISAPAAALTLGIPGGSASSPGIDYRATFGGGHPQLWTLRVMVQAAHEESAIVALDAYLSPVGPRSILTVLEDNGQPLALDGVEVADFVQVPSLIQAGPMEWAGAPYLGAEWAVEVHAT